MIDILLENWITALVSYLGITAIGIIGGLWIFSKFLGKKWIENAFTKEIERFKSEKAQELEILKISKMQDLENFKSEKNHELTILFNRKNKWNEKEFEVIHELWKYLMQARDTISLVLSKGFVANSSYNETYNEKYKISFQKYEQFCDYFYQNKIFLELDIKLLFQKVLSEIIYLNQEGNKMHSYFIKSLKYDNRCDEDYDKCFKEINEIMTEIEKLIQKKLFPKEK